MTEGSLMIGAATWREKAAMLRDRARETDDVDRRRVLLALAEDCDQLASEIEEAGAPEVGITQPGE
jgi:hypothetical protein